MTRQRKGQEPRLACRLAPGELEEKGERGTEKDEDRKEQGHEKL